jgi:hypothetical protein
MKKYGLDSRWEMPALESYIKQLIAQALRRLQQRKRSHTPYLRKFKISDKLVSLILTPGNFRLQYALVQYSLSKMHSKEIIRSLAHEINTLIREK